MRKRFSFSHSNHPRATLQRQKELGSAGKTVKEKGNAYGYIVLNEEEEKLFPTLPLHQDLEHLAFNAPCAVLLQNSNLEVKRPWSHIPIS